MKRSIEQKVFTGFAVALVIFATIGWLAYQSTVSFMHASTQAARSQETITALEEIFSLANQAETRQRMYLISGDERHLAPRNTHIDRIHVLFGNVSAATRDDPGQQALLRQLDQHIETRLALLEGVLEMRRERGFEQARLKLMAGNGEREMDGIRDSVRRMQKGEAARLQQWVDTSRQNGDRMLITFFVALVFVTIFFSVLFAFIAREMAARKRSQEQLAKQAEQLREGEARLRAVVGTAAEGIIVIDEQGIVESFNPAAERIFGFPKDEVEGHNVSMLMPAPYSQEHDGYLERYRSTGEKKIIGIGREVIGQHKGGSEFPLELAVAEMYVGGHRKFTGMVRDISARKQAEAQQAVLMHELESANEELKSFAYVVSHDLKAPLRAIGSLADWISTDYADKFNDDGKEHMRLLISRVHRMDNLIEGILRYSRVGRVTEAVVAADLNQLVGDVIDLLAPPANITVSVRNPLPTIVTEPTRIQQVFQNLLSNAIQYMDKPRGEISITCGAEGRQWKFGVSDNGPGIESRHFDRIFQMFQTLAPRDRVESTGVGLALVKKIVEMYGGRIWVESRLGEGSAFFFTLPKTVATASPTKGKRT